MPIELKMPALSPTMEEGTLAKWLVKEGDEVKSGDILAEIETDKATMEFEAVDEGTIGQIIVAEGSDGVKVGAPIAILLGADEAGSVAHISSPVAPGAAEEADERMRASPTPRPDPVPEPEPVAKAQISPGDSWVKASPLARRLAEQRGVDLTSITGSGPNGRVLKADLGGSTTKDSASGLEEAGLPLAAPLAPSAVQIPDIPHDALKLSNMRKTIARRLTESKQTVPHIYLTVDVRIDALLDLRTQLNQGLEARGMKLSVNDMLIKALALALMEVPSCNVILAGDQLTTFRRADISVAVSIAAGLITPIVTGADTKSLSAIAGDMKDLAGRAREGKLQPEEYQGGTASLSNMGMFGIKQFEAVINPPQGMIMAVGAAERRAWVVGEALSVATVLSATGSFDHRAIDGADGAKLMASFKRLVESPLELI